jgi:hypothetical protein
VIHSYASSESLESQSPNSSSQLSAVIIFLIYYGYGLLVVYRYYQTGLLVVSELIQLRFRRTSRACQFAILGPISLVFLGTILVSLIIRIKSTTKEMGVFTAGTIVAMIFVTLCLLASFLQVNDAKKMSHW